MTNEELFMNRRRALDLLGDPGDGHLTEEEMIGGANVDDEDVFGEGDIEAADRLLRLGNNADTLVQKAMLRQHQQRGMQQIAPFARINPPSVLKGTLGGQQDVTVVAGGLDASIQVVNWAGEDSETLPLTVTFAPVEFLSELVGKASANAFFRPYGIINWGTRGMSARAEVDIGRGCQFTIAGSAITLQVAMEAPPVDANDASMRLYGGLSFYPCAKNAPVTRTRYASGGGGGATVSVDVPPFAKSVSILHTLPAAALTMTFRSIKAGGAYYQVVFAGGTNSQPPIPLGNDTGSIDVVVAAGDTAYLIFNLDL